MTIETNKNSILIEESEFIKVDNKSIGTEYQGNEISRETIRKIIDNLKKVYKVVPYSTITWYCKVKGLIYTDIN